MAVISLSFMAFCAVTFLGYFILPMKARPYWLLLASLFFYSSFGAKPFIFIALSIATTFACAHITSALQAKGKHLQGAELRRHFCGALVKKEF